MKNDLPELAPQALPSVDALTALLRDQRAACARRIRHGKRACSTCARCARC